MLHFPSSIIFLNLELPDYLIQSLDSYGAGEIITCYIFHFLLYFETAGLLDSVTR